MTINITSVQPSFQAKLRNTAHIENLTKNEIAHGRHNAYKEALKNLNAVHKGDILDLKLLSDGKTYKVVNERTGCIGTIDYTGNLTNTVNEIARPTSKIHKNVFNGCDCSQETNSIIKELYV